MNNIERVLIKAFLSFIYRDEGQGTAEYAVIVAVVVIVAIGGLVLLRTKIVSMWTSIQQSFDKI